MKIFKAAAAAALFALASCTSDTGDSATVSGFESTPNQLQYRIIEKANNGAALQPGQYVLTTVTMRTLNGDLLGIPDHTKSGYSQVTQPRFKGDPLEVLLHMGSGDSASVIVNEKSMPAAFAQNPSNVKKTDNIRMDIRVIRAFTAEQYRNEVVPALNAVKHAGETKLIDEYIASQGWNAETTPSGLKVVVDSKGKGAAVTDDAHVKVNYTGRLLSGTVFDSNVLPEFNHVQPFQLTVGRGMVIPGWDEGLKHFNQGGKGKLIIPARLGYGERGSGQTIPPNSPLVFDVEILEVRK